MALHAVVMAAGEGKRLKTRLAKVLHQAAGRSLLDHVLAALAPLRPATTVVVIGHLRDQIAAHLAGCADITTVIQDPPRGTGDAVAQALPYLPGEGELLIVSGDTPLLTSDSLAGLLRARRERDAAVAITTAVLADAGGFGRVIRDATGDVVGIVEARDATAAQSAIREVNAGSYACDLARLRPLLAALSPDNAQCEYYLTDVVRAAVGRGWPVAGHILADPSEMAGVNTRAELAEVHRLLSAHINATWQSEGVTILDPATTWIEAGCTIGPDTVIEPGVHLRRDCHIGARCRIGANSVLTAVALGDGELVAPLSRL